MKQLVIFILLAIAITATSCERRYNSHVETRQKTQVATILPVNNSVIVISSVEISYNHRVQHIIVDKCEYILYHGSSQGSGKAITHHYNCSNHAQSIR